MTLDPWFIDNLRCPVDQTRLELADNMLVSSGGRRYPVVDGVPIMLLEEPEPTLWVSEASLDRAKHGATDERAAELHLDSLGVSSEDRELIYRLYRENPSHVDPVVAYLQRYTSGTAYWHLMGKLKEYPIPGIRLPAANGSELLDVGCNWGRWSIAAARKGYSAIGIDPSLGAIMAAKRVAGQLGLANRYVVADGRYLPFEADRFDVSFSFGVIQHMKHSHAKSVLTSMVRVLKPGGHLQVQMAHRLGLRSLHVQLMRGFREPRGFAVRYWSIGQIREALASTVGSSRISVNCYFGLGLDRTDAQMMHGGMRALVGFSELLRGASKALPFMKYFADSLYVDATKPGSD